jgi:AraC family transcriptional regulator
MTAPNQDPITIAAHEAAVGRAIVAMQDSLFEPAPLGEVASTSFYSRFHFHRTFCTITGTTPGRFLACLRMQRAKELLADTTLTVAAVGGLVSYESLGTFTTQFGRLVGTSPGRFRHLVDACSSDIRLCDVDTSPDGSRNRVTPVHCRAGTLARLDTRTTIVGLFNADVPIGLPSRFAMIAGADGYVEAAAARSALALSVYDNVRLVDLAIGRTPDVLVGRAVAPDGVTPITLDLSSPRIVDPPVISVAAVTHLLGSAAHQIGAFSRSRPRAPAPLPRQPRR